MASDDESDVLVRLARYEDLGDLVSLLGILFEQEDEFHAQPTAPRLALATLLAAPDRSEVILAERSGRAVGMVVLQLVLSTAMGGRAALLEDMVVDPSVRGEGVGSLLLSAAIERAARLGCRRITLLTDAENARAQRFYRRHGFIASTMVPMRLTLDPG